MAGVFNAKKIIYVPNEKIQLRKSDPEWYFIGNRIEQHPECKYYQAWSERSNGKTYGALEYAVYLYAKTGLRSAYVRRMETDIIGQRSAELMSHINADNIVSYYFKQFNYARYYNRTYTLCHVTDDGTIDYIDSQPFLYIYAISQNDHDKGSSPANMGLIILDEFVARNEMTYLKDEPILFWNTISTIAREKDLLKIIMLGNSISIRCPYFVEMGINIRKIKQGTSCIYQYGEEGQLKVFCEYVDMSQFRKKPKASDVYFAFDNPKLKMITTGAYEFEIYRHLPVDYYFIEDNVVGRVYAKIEDSIFEMMIVSKDSDSFLYVKPADYGIEEDTIVYSLEDSPSLLYHRSWFQKNGSQMDKTIKKFFDWNKVFYSDNEVGEMINHYNSEFMKDDKL